MKLITKVVFYIVNFASIFPAQNLEPRVTLKDLSEGSSIVGSNLTLECRTTFNLSYISIEWVKPENVDPAFIKEEIVSNENITSPYLTTSRLTAFQANERYEGQYQCKVTHNQWKYSVKSDVLYVHIYGIGYYINQIEERSEFDPLEAELKVKYLAHPKVTIAWFDKNNELIKESSNFSMSTSFKNGLTYAYETKLHLKYINNDNLGVYRLDLYNEFKNVSQNINVFLQEQINSSLSIDRIDEDKMQVTYKCSAVGLKKPIIAWYFVPCKFCLLYKIQNEEKEWMMSSSFGGGQVLAFDGINHYTDRYIKEKFKQMIKSNMKHKLEESYVEDGDLHVSSYISLNLSETGILSCVTQDSVEMSRFFFVQDGFDILINDDNENFINAKKVNYPTYGQTVKLPCVVSLYTYESVIQWSHNGTIVDKNHYIFKHSDKSKISDKFWYTLKFQFISEAQAGNYTCKVLNKNGEIKSKTVVLKFQKMQNFLPKVVLYDLNAGHTMAGGNISLKCEIEYYKPFSEILWAVVDSSVGYVKTKDDLSFIMVNISDTNITTTMINSTIYVTTSQVTIPEYNVIDGLYHLCGVNSFVFLNYSYLRVPVYGPNVSLISIDKNTSVFDIYDMTIRISMTVHPRPMIHWFDNNGEEIKATSSKFSIIANHELAGENNYGRRFNCETVLSFKRLDFEDFGNYTVVVDNNNKQESFTVEVNVTGVPSVKIDVYKLDEENMTSTVKCASVAYPEPSIEWYFTECAALESCLNLYNGNEYKFVQKEEQRHEKTGSMVVSYLSVNISERGMLRCQSSNSFGNNHADQLIFHVENEMDFFIEHKNKRPLSNIVEIVGYKPVRIICIASNFIYKETALWEYDGERITLFDYTPFESHNYNFVFSTGFVMRIYPQLGYEEDYTCDRLTKDGIVKSKTLKTRTQGAAFASISKSNMFNTTTELKLNSNWKFYCYGKGFPTPTIKWFKDNHTIESSERIKFTNYSQELELSYVFPEDEGIYSCEVSNEYISSSKFHKLIITNKYTWLYVQLSLLLLAFSVVSVLFVFKLRVERRSEKLLLYFEKGALGMLNPELRIEDQANLLPYNKQWEIPVENIKLGKQLGSGAFGVVFQAEVINFFTDENSKTVAVKTIDPHSGIGSVKALASELKIMGHLGKHVNIVNFLGACTRNIAKRELYVIVEYCQFGNLRDYMLHHRKDFVDQKNKEWDDFDYSNEAEKKEVADGLVSICSRDLVIWAFQVARGMEYLSSRRIVHGDLAARNVLLADNNILKISDFGLSKKLYELGNYVKKRQGPLPVKWLAVECLENGIFSIESDIWSFGIVIWEIFSLGKMPYPGVVFDETFYQKLNAGYRMTIPEAATGTIYNIMMDCWNLDPQQRPSFTDLVDRVGLLLNDAIRKYYVDMNGGYIAVSNPKSVSDSEDFLMKINPPTFANILSTTRTYVNTSTSDNSPPLDQKLPNLTGFD